MRGDHRAACHSRVNTVPQLLETPQQLLCKEQPTEAKSQSLKEQLTARMLPPDTSSLLPWRVMVPLMQVSGSFPYKMSAKSDPPTFSLPLCLWTVFVQVLIMALNIGSFKDMFLDLLTQEIGTATYFCTTIIMMVMWTLCPVILAVKSSTLAALLHDMSLIKGVSSPPSRRWYCRPHTLLFLTVVSAFTILPTIAISTMMELSYPWEMIPILFLNIFCALRFLLPEELPSMVFGFLGRRLVAATEDTVATVSALLPSDGSFMGESNTEAAMLALRELDAVIQEVEEQRETGTSYFFPVVSMYLLVGLLLAIACPYAMMDGTLVGGIIFVDILLGYYIIARFYFLGQAFVSQVSKAERLLKKLRVKSQSHIVNVKVSQVMGSLSPLLTFDMCGWYTLDYASLLGLINTVVTYLVIIFQVGGVRINITRSSPPPTNSTTQ